MKHIYYKNDFAVEITLLNASGEVVAPPDWQWHIEFTDGRRKYICSVDKGNANVVGNTIMCYLDNHKFCCGEIGYKFVQAIPDLNYLDGFQNLITPKALPIELWEQESDNDINIQSSVVPAYVVYDAYMTAKANGYTGTAEEFYDALNHIVDISKKEAERVEAEANRVTAEQQRAENFIAMESALTTATSKANTATTKAEEASKRADNSATAASQARVQATIAANGANAAAAQATQAMEKTNTATENAKTATANANTSAVNAGNAATEANEAAKNANDATEKAKTATTAAEQSAERANTAAENADVATSNATTATTQATTATKRANDISSDLEAKREADYWRGSKGVKGDDGVSPTVTTSKTGKVTTIEITDANGVHTATVNDGDSVEVVQSTGTSTTAVMSQKAVSDELSEMNGKVDELESEVIYDVTTNNSGTTFDSLSALLSNENLSTLIPSEVRCGGMSIRFVQSSDNKYVQYRLMSDSWSAVVTNWQGIDDEPTTESENLVKSGGVKNAIKDTLPKSTLEEGIYICNNEGKAVIRLDVLDNIGGFGSHLINVINTLIENVTNEISLRVGNIESTLLRTANITNAQEDGFYITDENGHVLIRLDVLDSANGFGDNLYQFILNLINDKAALIKSTASDTLFVTDERGNACACYKDGKWEMPLSSKYNIDRFRSRSMVFGVEIDRYDYSVKRIADSVGLQSNYKIGTNFVNDGNNDFDSIFPWCDIKLCNVQIDENGNKTITYQDEEGFARDGSNGDVMVEIPKFYTFRKVEGTKEYVCISGEHKSGFVLEPAFTDDNTGEEIDYIYVGAYLTKIIDNKNTSISNVTPTQRYFLNYREAGNMFDFVTYQAIRKLFLIEFATIDSSTIFGGLSYLPFWYYVYATEDSDGAVNEADFYSMENKPELGGYNIDYLFVGANITVNNRMNIAEDRKVISLGEPEEFTLSDASHTVVHKRHVVFSGNPVVIKGNPTGQTSYDENYDTNITLLYAIRQDNGLTDAIDYHSGRAGLTTNNVADQFKYRNIEGLWGNIGQYIDGVKVKNLEYYVSSKRSEYGDISKYTKLSYATPRKAQGEADTYMWQTAIIKTMGYDRQNPTVMLPDAITSDGSGEIHLSYGDIHNANASQDVEYVLYSSMAWDGGYGNGLFVDRFWDTANYTQSEDVGGLVGSRMCVRKK